MTNWYSILFDLNLAIRNIYSLVMLVESIYNEQILGALNSEIYSTLTKPTFNNLLEFFLTNKSSPEIDSYFSKIVTKNKIQQLYSNIIIANTLIRKICLTKILHMLDKILILTTNLRSQANLGGFWHKHHKSCQVSVQSIDKFLNSIESFYNQIFNLASKLHKNSYSFRVFCVWLEQKKLESEKNFEEKSEKMSIHLSLNEENTIFEFLTTHLYEKKKPFLIKFDINFQHLISNYKSLSNFQSNTLTKLDFKEINFTLKNSESPKAKITFEGSNKKFPKILLSNGQTTKQILKLKTVSNFENFKKFYKNVEFHVSKKIAGSFGVIYININNKESDLIVIDLQENDESEEDD